MKTTVFRGLTTIALCVTCQGVALSKTAKPAAPLTKTQRALIERLLANPIRQAETDICFPATSEEYAALGKNAVLMVTASTAIGNELPLKAVFVKFNGVRIPLHRIALLDKFEEVSRDGEERNVYTKQVSFYVLPITFMKRDAELAADFSGERTSFGITKFTKDGSSLAGSPAFARLDEYDDPTDPDPAAIQALLRREYPDHFPR